MIKKDNINPPYGSVNRLRSMFELFSTHNFPQITSSFLKSRGFSGSDAFQTISALKFLGILDSEGNKTEKMSKLQLKGEQRTQSIQEILKSSYAKLFETVEEPNKMSKDDLYNDFISIYGLSSRLASTSVPNFLWLCKEAGLEIAENFELKERKSRTKNPTQVAKPIKKTEVNKEEFKNALSIGTQVELGEFELILPKDWDMNKTRQAIAKGDFKAVYDELIKLSKQLRKDKEEVKV